MLFGQVGIPGVQTGTGMAAETAWRLEMVCEVDEETEAAVAPATTTVRATIRRASFIGNILLAEI
jgi:hypothetical protein